MGIDYVMLADDDDDDRSMFEEVLAEVAPQLQFEAAVNGEELMRLLTKPDSHKPFVIFLDLNMPFKDGRACLTEIRGNSTLHQVPVVIYSTSSNLNDIHETYQKGANLYMIKPSSYSELRALARKFFRMNPQEYALPTPMQSYVFSSK